MTLMNKQSGLSLVELMVSLLIGSIIVATSIELLSVNQRAANMLNSLTSMDNGSNFAIDMISNDIRLAGYSVDVTDDLVKSPIDFTKTIEGGNIDTNDSISVQYVAGVSGISSDCTGNPVADGELISNTYEVIGGVLTCNGVGIIANIESFQVVYGVDFDNNASPDRYLEANNASAYNGTGSERVVSVRYSLILSSEKTFEEKPAKEIRALNEGLKLLAAGKMYNTYTKTVVLYNML